MISNKEQISINNPQDGPIKKKRGRKKKIKTPEEIKMEENKPKQRRGRKPKSQMIVKKDISELINKKDDDTIILNLKINNDNNSDNKDLDKQFNTTNKFKYNPVLNCPTGYDTQNNEFLSKPSNITSNINNPIKINEIKVNDNNKQYYNSLEQFIENKDWIRKTNVKCWWCCHDFDNTPIGLPIKYKNNKFFVTGCFCSLECCSSYNFYENNKVQDEWECYSLINLLSQKLGYKNIVKLAPHKIALKIFGGYLDINEFRNLTNKNKMINILDYPMIATNQQLEEINYNTDNNSNNFIPIDENRLKKIEQKIKLSRNKPLNNNKNTLEHTMNIKIST
jgi:hypothetical protein